MRPTLFKAVALFVIVCGVVALVFTGSGTEPGSEEAPPTPLERAISSLEATQRAQRALDAANYGIVSHELSRLEGQLTKIIAGLTASRVGAD